ncbi:MAG: phosphoribosylamine--glycine ligase [Actinobacteria bacterium]|nr:phosphoribosylamine--glycine ligase [Actinomycetota bacterium]
MRVLVVGGGGREHALAWRLATSASVTSVETAPGNAGTDQLGPTHPIDTTSPHEVAGLAERRGADLVVIGPEAPLVAGVADELRRRAIPVFGPSADAARIEGSKAYAKDVMAAAGVPTGSYGAFTDAAAAKETLEGYAPPYVVKADGLAAGKGVRICPTLDEAHRAVDDAIVHQQFGEAGSRVVIEEYLDGPEASVFGIAAGREVVLLSPSRDFKRALDGDGGPNTGGMGAYTPLQDLPEPAALVDLVFRPVLAELAERGTPYHGLLYAGLVLTATGPQVLEFNCRFGDPETQVVVPRIAGDFGEVLRTAADGDVSGLHIDTHEDAFVTVVLASGGYPEAYETGRRIDGLDDAGGVAGATVFHAGTRREDGDIVTAGGRVLAVTGRGLDVASARATAYEAADHIRWPGQHRRNDIAQEVAG